MTTKITEQNISNISNAAVQWQTVVTADGSTATSAVAGRGYFIDTTSAAHTVNLPNTASVGDTIILKDYTGTWGTNNVTISSTLKISGADADGTLSTNNTTVTIVYMDTTKGWTPIQNSTQSALAVDQSFITATGGTVLTSGNFKTHIFTGDGCFVVSCAGNPAGSTKLDYLVVAGGGSGAGYYAAGGAGGFRYSNNYCLPAPTTSPLATTGICASATTYPVTVGGGGAANPSAPGIGGYDGNNGSNSVFSTITSAGGGFGASGGPTVVGGNGGSGGNSGYFRPACGQGQGNTPPVSPPQGNPAGRSSYANGGGGGGAGAAGSDGTINGTWNGSPVPGPNVGGNGGVGSYIADTFFGPTAPSYGTPGPVGSTRYFAGGGGGGVCQGQPGPSGSGGAGGGGDGAPNSGPFGSAQNGTANTGGGGAGSGGGTGGKGFVAIRYKFQ